MLVDYIVFDLAMKESDEHITSEQWHDRKNVC